RWPSGRGKQPLASPMLPPSAPRGDPMATACSFALATALLVARLLGGADQATAPPASGFYIRAASLRVTPRTAGYDYGATWGMAPAGLPPARTAVSLAALPPVGPVGLTSPPSTVLDDATTATGPARGSALLARAPIPGVLPSCVGSP